MTSKMTTHNYQQKTKTKTKQTIRTGAESQQWTSHGRLSAGEWEEEREGKGTENR